MTQIFKNIRRFFPVWLYLTWTNISVYTRGSYLGVFWTLLFPLLQMFIFLAIFSSIFNNSSLQLFYAVAPSLFAWNFFVKTTTALCTCLDASAIKMTAVPNLLFPLARVFDDFPAFLVGFICIIGGRLVFTGVVPWIFIFHSFAFVFLFLLFIVGVGLALSSFQVFFRDTSYIWNLFCQTGIFVTPVFFPESFITESRYWHLLRWNPLFYFLKSFRDPLIFGELPAFGVTLTCVLLAFCCFGVGMTIFSRLNRYFINYL